MSRSPEGQMRDVANRIAGALPAVLATGTLLAAAIHVATTEHANAWVPYAELLVPGFFAVVLFMGAYVYRADQRRPRDLVRLGVWSLRGWLALGLTATAWVVGQRAAGAQLAEPVVATYLSALGGAVLGLGLGLYEEAHEQARDRVRALTRRFAFLNRILRHDVRNDASIIVGNAELLEDDLGPSEELTFIQQAAQHVVELTHTARVLEQAQAPLELEPTPLAPVLARSVRHVRTGFPHAVFELTQAQADELVVEADELLTSVFENLLRNAVQHHDGDTPRIEVTVEADESRVRVRIADDGPGIPENVREDLFAEGVKGEGSTGTGMGLFLVRELVEGYQGRVDLTDRSPRGTVVTIELPRA